MLTKAPILLLLTTALSIFTAVVSAQNKVEKTPLSIGMAIDSLVSRQMKEQHITGLSLGIIINGTLFKTQGYGLSNIEQTVSASTKTVYKIGSLSKQVVATATMLFVQEGKLRLTDTLPMFFKGAPKSWNKVTIRHLLNHTSGLPRESPVSDNMKLQPDSVLIKAAYQSKLLFEPGTSWQYCNLGYFMLADIIRQLSGKRLPRTWKTKFLKSIICSKQGPLHLLKL
jgi:CubicO group peptidase (beta-lactamase class C family)